MTAWADITILEVSPGARILESLMFRLRDNPIATAEYLSVVPDSERARVPQCLRTNSTNRSLALAKSLLAPPTFIATTKWRLAVFQTAGAWNLAGGVGARDYFIEMWGAGGAGTKGGTQRGGGSGAYLAGVVSVGAGVAIGGVVGAGGTTSGAAGGNTTLTTGPATATVYGGTAGGTGGAAPIWGGTFSNRLNLLGLDADAYVANSAAIDVTSMGAPAPLIGGSSSALFALSNQAFKPNPVVGCGGAGTFASYVTAQNGGDGMVLVWWLE